ncbi:MAG: hypothetical protein JRI55_03895 [Deltaproteobacteria bacterium]|jgi:hypothetical protein|nr:hypothetical protein [Deltaproteobacteria bacterium]
MVASAALALVGTACSDDDGGNPPALHVEASPIVVGQGQAVEIPVELSDPDGDAVTASFVSADPGLEVEWGEAEQQLALRASYDVIGPIAVTAELSDGAGDAATQDLLVEVAPIRWLGTSTWASDGPEAREHGTMVVAPDGGYAVLFGGSGYDPYLTGLADAWHYDLTTGVWTAVTPTGEVPAAGGSRRAAQVAGSTVAYLFGGYGDGGSPNHAELYALDVAGGQAAFSVVAQQNPPPARALHAFVHDPATDRFFLFGGAAGAPLDDTWVMTLEGGTAVWAELALEPRPTARYGFFYGFDAEAGRLMVYSGAQGFNPLDPASDTWALDVRADPPTWQLVVDAAAGPPGRRNGCQVFDPSGPRLWVFGGTPDAATTAPGLWVLDARAGREGWRELVLDGEPPLRSSGFGFYDPAQERTLLGFGNTTTMVFRDLSAIGY